MLARTAPLAAIRRSATSRPEFLRLRRGESDSTNWDGSALARIDFLAPDSIYIGPGRAKAVVCAKNGTDAMFLAAGRICWRPGFEPEGITLRSAWSDNSEDEQWYVVPLSRHRPGKPRGGAGLSRVTEAALPEVCDNERCRDRGLAHAGPCDD